MNVEQERHSIRFQPTRPVSRPRTAISLLLGPVVWALACWLGVVLLGHGPVLYDVMLVAAFSFSAAAVFLLGGVRMRRREERCEP